MPLASFRVSPASSLRTRNSLWLPSSSPLVGCSIPGFQDPRRLCGRPLSDTSGQPRRESAHSHTRTGYLLPPLSSGSLPFRGFTTPGVCVVDLCPTHRASPVTSLRTRPLALNASSPCYRAGHFHSGVSGPPASVWSTSVRHLGLAQSRVCALAHSHWLPPVPALEQVTFIPGLQDPRRLCCRCRCRRSRPALLR